MQILVNHLRGGKEDNYDFFVDIAGVNAAIKDDDKLLSVYRKHTVNTEDALTIWYSHS